MARRLSARVLAVNPLGEVLLLVIRRDDGSPGLMTPGGGVEAGESEEEAAVRELREEIGVVVATNQLRGPLLRAELGGRDHVFFAVAVDHVEVDFAGQQPDELGYVVGHEWLTPAALADDPRVRFAEVRAAAARAVVAVRPAVRRRTARVLPVNAAGEVLLLQERDPARPDRHYWSSIGGGIDGDETARSAAAREMFEETGLPVSGDELVGPVTTVENSYSWGGVDYLGRHAYFALPLEPGADVTFEHLEAEEVGNVLGSGWWSPDAIGGVEHEPPELSDIMRTAIDAVGGAGRGTDEGER